jgi:hypothetical protein
VISLNKIWIFFLYVPHKFTIDDEKEQAHQILMPLKLKGISHVKFNSLDQTMIF